ncbi:crotonobetainyl-CoA:carnitine CoA-transferase CaiB-like acyl-CoA transferase [Rhodococcus rhodochrous J45]|uniref:Crotonobetainyl-CoA:carnitine CoA-transferase CaiB-like acyl-CoA transferase n=1 Tax=Rhodococcus rhodochrous J45 TaxID=935266 RepID=A0A562E8H8_RHORH|nr:CoA transferase [Rhodococcus rhodochrous]TWH18053.1 crotonobetainyl-CoA:carnitine CoA-transferase CaiB-like acyl-CoA transferase [Rhodococcus rhodochrous J45]
MNAVSPASTAPLHGLTVIDLSLTTPGAYASVFLADAGADVIMVEPPAGNPMRKETGWPALARGKKSVTLDLQTDTGLTALHDLLRSADVLITTSRPAALERLGLTPDDLADLNPRLVSASITGWGTTGPWANDKGYEALVLARMGVFHGKAQMSERPGPSFTPTPWAAWGAAHTAVQGVLSALYERESSGVGQHVEADLLRGAASMDTYNWFFELVCARWPDAYQAMYAFDDQGRPAAPLIYPLLVAQTKDGHWLQFAQTEPRLFFAMMTEFGLAHVFADPYWQGLPIFEDVERRVELRDIMLEKVRERTLAEWQHVFDTNPDVSAEIFNDPVAALDHPQLQHDGRVVTVDDPDLGPVRQPSTLVHVDGKPLTELRPAPRLGADTEQVLAGIASGSNASSTTDAPTGALPLAGVTILELGSMFAAPYGATLLTDLGARVLKVEPLAGDSMRGLVAFPEAGGAKVLQGKESVALDINTPEGLAIVHELAKKSDIVLQSYRAGAAERIGVDAATLKALNPDLVYLNAPGYGTGGPYGGRPAYAPSVGAASGLSMSDLGGLDLHGENLEEIKRIALRRHTAGANPSVQADGVAALGVASSMLLGLLARKRGYPMGDMTATMLSSATHALMDRNIDYANRPEPPVSDPDLYGLGALYRLYEASDGWIFLAAPQDSEWNTLVEALKPYTDLAQQKFSTPDLRRTHATDLAESLDAVLRTRSKFEWEKDLGAQDIGCVAVTERTPESHLQGDEYFEAGYTVLADSPIFDEHRRLAPLTRFSRSKVKADAGCTIGEHTDSILAEIGFDPERIAELREKGIVG